MAEQDAMNTPGMMSPTGAEEAAQQKSIPREAPKVSAERVNLVKQQVKRINGAKKHFDKPFKRMKVDRDFAYKWGVGSQWPGQTEDDDRYIANVVQRHVNTRVAALYAKNPTVVAKPKRRREFKIWDGKLSTVQEAMMAMQNAQMSLMPPPPEVIDILTDVQQGMLRREMVKNIGDTLEILFTYFMKEQVPNFKDQMKALVRRTEVCGVGYVKIGYQRLYAPKADKASRIDDVTSQMQTIDRLRADVLDGVTKEDDAKYEELKLALENIQKEPEIIVREGLVWDWPQSDRIIIDPACSNIIGFVGATWVAEEFEMTVDEVKEIYQKDVKSAAEAVVARETLWGRADTDMPTPETAKVKVYCLYDRKTGLKYCLCEGYDDFLAEPAAPEVRVEQFFPYYPLVFNAVEHPTEIYPPSDVRLLRSQQIEYNRIKESLRQHRIANRPLYATPAGALDDSDKESEGQVSLANYPAHAVLTLNGLADGEKIGDKLQAVPKVPVDPNLYETEGTFADMERVTGSQEANLGGTSNSTATESNIAEGSRLSSLQSNADDLDSILTLMARDGGQVLLLECTQESVLEIVGPGAVWPELTRGEIVKELYLDIEAGSSGRPNKATDIANFERMGPLMMQMPEQDPEKLVKYAWKILDDKIDANDMMKLGMPSIIALNGMVQPSTGDASTDPNAQGMQGGRNAQQPALPAPGPQAPAPQGVP